MPKSESRETIQNRLELSRSGQIAGNLVRAALGYNCLLKPKGLPMPKYTRWFNAAPVLCLLLFAGSSVAAVPDEQPAQPHWPLFHSQDSNDCRFSVALPVKPTIESESGDFPMWSYTVKSKRGVYKVDCVVSPPSLSSRGRESTILLGSRDKTLSIAGGKLSDDRAITLGGFPGRAFTFSFTTNRIRFIGYYEYVLTDRTLYTVSVIIPTDFVKVDRATDVDYFINSLSIDSQCAPGEHCAP